MPHQWWLRPGCSILTPVRDGAVFRATMDFGTLRARTAGLAPHPPSTSPRPAPGRCPPVPRARLFAPLGPRTPTRHRPCLAIVLRDVHTSDRLMSILRRLQSFVQVQEVLLQFPPVLLLRDSIHSHRPVLADSTVGPLKRCHINEMRQPFLVALFRLCHRNVSVHKRLIGRAGRNDGLIPIGVEEVLRLPLGTVFSRITTAFARYHLAILGSRVAAIVLRTARLLSSRRTIAAVCAVVGLVADAQGVAPCAHPRAGRTGDVTVVEVLISSRAAACLHAVFRTDAVAATRLALGIGSAGCAEALLFCTTSAEESKDQQAGYHRHPSNQDRCRQRHGSRCCWVHRRSLSSWF